MKSIYHIVTHPNLAKSRVNKVVINALQGKERVETRILYEAYPDWRIDVEREKQSLLRADVVVVQTPFYWYSTPALFKEWQDKVLEYGFAYGEGGDKLKGKIVQVVLSAFGPEEAYTATGYNRYTIDELLRPLESTFALCQMKFAPPLTLLGVSHKSDEDVRVFANTVATSIERL